jgi:glycosyltransferase involved in cell wall biosynthesis
LIINAGVGDSDSLINDWRGGVLIENFSEEDYAEAAQKIEAMIAEPEVRRKARAVAEQLFSLHTIGAERYASLYEKVLELAPPWSAAACRRFGQSGAKAPHSKEDLVY